MPMYARLADPIHHLRHARRQEKDPILNRGVPDALIRHVLNEIAIHVQSAYCAKSIGDPAIDKVAFMYLFMSASSSV